MSSFVQSTGGYLGGPEGRRFIKQRGTLTLAGEGADTADIPASVFGLAKILDVGVAIKSDNSEVLVVTPSADGTSLLVADLTQSTDGDRADVADATGDYVLTITGE